MPAIRRTIALASLSLLMSQAIALAQFPRTGVAEVPNGEAQPFVGTWKMAFPQTDDTIFAETLYDCTSPVEIIGPAADRIVYRTERGETEFELMAFAERTSWLPEGGASSIAVWTGPDAFLLYSTDGMGKADWTNPYEFTRCS